MASRDEGTSQENLPAAACAEPAKQFKQRSTGKHGMWEDSHSQSQCWNSVHQDLPVFAHDKCTPCLRAASQDRCVDPSETSIVLIWGSMRKYEYVAENHANEVPDRTTMPKGISVIAASPGHELVFHKWKSFAEGRNKRNKWQRHWKESRTMDKHKQKTTNNTHYGHNFWLKCTILEPCLSTIDFIDLYCTYSIPVALKKAFTRRTLSGILCQPRKTLWLMTSDDIWGRFVKVVSTAGREECKIVRAQTSAKQDCFTSDARNLQSRSSIRPAGKRSGSPHLTWYRRPFTRMSPVHESPEVQWWLVQTCWDTHTKDLQRA